MFINSWIPSHRVRLLPDSSNVHSKSWSDWVHSSVTPPPCWWSSDLLFYSAVSSWEFRSPPSPPLYCPAQEMLTNLPSFPFTYRETVVRLKVPETCGKHHFVWNISSLTCCYSDCHTAVTTSVSWQAECFGSLVLITLLTTADYPPLTHFPIVIIIRQNLTEYFLFDFFKAIYLQNV